MFSTWTERSDPPPVCVETTIHCHGSTVARVCVNVTRSGTGRRALLNPVELQLQFFHLVFISPLTSRGLYDINMLAFWLLRPRVQTSLRTSACCYSVLPREVEQK